MKKSLFKYIFYKENMVKVLEVIYGLRFKNTYRKLKTRWSWKYTSTADFSEHQQKEIRGPQYKANC